MGGERDAGTTARRCSEAMHAKDVAAQTLGMTIKDSPPGGATLEMTVTKTMLNGHDVCHGGLVFSLADTAFAHACNSYNQVTLAMSADIDFVRSARLGDVLTAIASERKRGGRTGVYDVEVFNQNNELVAVFRGRSYSTRDPLVETSE